MSITLDNAEQTKDCRTLPDDPQAQNPLTREEILKLKDLIYWMNTDGEKKLALHESIKAKLESYLEVK